MLWVLIRLYHKAILMSTHNMCFYGEIKTIIPKLEPMFIKHYAPTNSLPLTVNSHHVLFQRAITPEK